MTTPGPRICSRCGVEKPYDAFHRGQGYKDGRKRQCKACEAEVLTHWRREHPEQWAAQIARANASAKRRRIGNYNPDPEARTKRALQAHNAYLLRRYGITVDEELRMLVEQEYLCAVCRESLADTHHVDHCHKTGRVRALLCGRCNVALGAAGDDPALLRALADYAEAHAVVTDR